MFSWLWLSFSNNKQLLFFLFKKQQQKQKKVFNSFLNIFKHCTYGLRYLPPSGNTLKNILRICISNYDHYHCFRGDPTLTPHTHTPTDIYPLQHLTPPPPQFTPVTITPVIITPCDWNPLRQLPPNTTFTLKF